ncbi:hypothetical protein [Pedobacter nyackensis]|uniref:Helix-hairpin-helix motif-containing protein n=1 Tax=Pedobacter nyackensis TaxID=475255 RepID=A0A1W2F3N3_9SPHI|nr:hypothetical protein [Pedobacter nyackensis]SMD16551.1 hypothetical protein SAMN04488101_12042 [Pedobacter nyackensis]
MKTLCLLSLLLLTQNAVAQEDEKNRDIIEALAEKSSENDDFSEVTERLGFFRKHHINLHKTTPEELKSLLFLSPLQINSFFSYIAKTRLLDILELQVIPGFDIETISRLLPFVTLTTLHDYDQLKPIKMLSTGEHELISRYTRLLKKQKGFRDLPGSRYLGSPEKALLRYRYNFQGIVSAAIVMEKDAGEHLFNKKTGSDHLSAHLALFKLGRVKKLVLGDYSLQFGQGLTLWSGFAFGKGPDVTSVAAKDVGLKPYTSANESSFFRGVASTVNLGRNIYLSSFISFRKLDASLKITTDGGYSLYNISMSGLHRTQTEHKNQKTLGQQVYGGVLQYISDNLNIGGIAYQADYEHQFTTGPQLYNKFSFTGKHFSNIGLHYNYTFQNIYLYGEIAHSIGSGMATINGAMASLSRKLSAVLLHRSYDINYQSFFSRSLGEGTETNNEKGWYAGLNYILPGNFIWSLYADYFKFPWLKYRVDSPSAGYELLSQISYTKGKTFKATIRFKIEKKQQNPDTGDDYNQLDQVAKQNYRLEWSWKLNVKFNFHQRTEITQYQKGIKQNEIGYLIYQDVNYSPISSKLSANIRLAWFNTPSYNSRIYAYENDVLHGSGSGQYSGKGIRTFMNIRYRPMKKTDVWFRYGLFMYLDVKTIGTGLDEIEGSSKSEVKIQIRYQF